MKRFIQAGLAVWLILNSFLLTAQTPRPASGTIKRFADVKSNFIDPRTVDVWLPQGYDARKQYAVLYMHDGQMLFDSTTTWNRQEWGVDETVGRLLHERKIRECIVVGIWNNGPKRHSEYFPQKPFESLPQNQRDSIRNLRRSPDRMLFEADIQSDNYLKFLVNELKPFIDRTFSTRPGRSDTFVAGSSMGGLISMYALCEYPDVFGGAACLSTHWPGLFTTENNPVPVSFLRYLEARLPSPKTHKIYFDYGTGTLDSLYKPYQQQADAILKKKGYGPAHAMSREFPGEPHTEQAWRRRLAVPLLFLLGDSLSN